MRAGARGQWWCRLGQIISSGEGLFPPETNDFAANADSGVPQTANGRPNSEPYGFTVKVIVTTLPDTDATDQVP